MFTRQRLFIDILSVFLLLGIFSVGNKVQGAEYPVKPIFFTVLGEAGSSADIMMRPITQKVSSILGQPLIVVNKPGAAGNIGLKEIHDAKPDGYTIGAALATILSNKMQGLSPYDHRDFTILYINNATHSVLFASNKTRRPFKTVQEAISFAKSHPGEVSIATSGVGYTQWIATLAFQEKTGVKFNVIPQPGTTGHVTAQVAGGHTDLGMGTLAATKPQIDAGNVRFLAMFGPKRAAAYPNVPTLKESIGYDIGVSSGSFIVGPPKMPAEIIDKLVKAWGIAAHDPESERLIIEEWNSLPMHLTYDKATQYLDEQREIIRSVMEKAGILKEK